MAADIVPVLAAITGLPQDEAEALYAEAWNGAKAENGGRADTKTFIEAVMAFRAAVPFNLEDLQAGWKAKEEVEGDSYRGTSDNVRPRYT